MKLKALLILIAILSNGISALAIKSANERLEFGMSFIQIEGDHLNVKVLGSFKPPNIIL